MKPGGSKTPSQSASEGIEPRHLFLTSSGIALVSEVGIAVISAADVRKADAVHKDADSMRITAKRGYKHLRGSLRP